jgi:hypothetical protein
MLINSKDGYYNTDMTKGEICKKWAYRVWNGGWENGKGKIKGWRPSTSKATWTMWDQRKKHTERWSKIKARERVNIRDTDTEQSRNVNVPLDSED